MNTESSNKMTGQEVVGAQGAQKAPSYDLEYNVWGLKRLYTKYSPKQILEEDFPRHEWPISGGWGYDKENAVAIELTNNVDGVALEHKFMEYRTYEEGIIFRPHGMTLAGIRLEMLSQTFHQGEDGRKYDCLKMKVSAFSEIDFEFLKRDWEGHHGYKNSPEGRMKHLKRAESKLITYEIEGWFEISNFMGRFE